jgi:hypothetical protein
MLKTVNNLETVSILKTASNPKARPSRQWTMSTKDCGRSDSGRPVVF